MYLPPQFAAKDPAIARELMRAHPFASLISNDDEGLQRQLELAEEFRQIGDVDGARELLQEVVDSASDAALKAKAQAMLDTLG